MAVSSAWVTVTTTATRLDTDETEVGHNGMSLVVQVPSTATQTVWLGGSDVDPAANGYPKTAGSEVAVNELGPNEHLYARVASGTQLVYVLRTGV